MMIVNWTRFNENKSIFTKEMAEEIVFYFTDGSKYSDELFDLLFSGSFVNEDDDFSYGDFSEASFSEMDDLVNVLFTKSKYSLEFSEVLINIYNKIREERKDFPEISEMIDSYINFIDDGFDFTIRYNHDEYNIILEKTYMGDFDVFFECANRVRNNLKKNSYSYLKECKYYVYKNGRSNMEFIIHLKK